jgi:virulence-associated protein VapD
MQIKKYERAIDKADDAYAISIMQQKVRFLEQQVKSLKEIRQLAAGTDFTRYQKFETDYIMGIGDISNIRSKRTLEQDKKELRNIKADYDALVVAIRNYKSAVRTMSEDAAVTQLAILSDKLQDLENRLSTIGDATPGLEKVRELLSSVASQISRMQSGDMTTIDEGIKAAQKGLQSMNNSLVNFMRRIATMALRRMFRDAVQFARAFADALNEIRVVTLKTNQEVEKLGKGYIELAKEMKLVGVEVAQAAVELYRQGLDDVEVEKRLKSAAQFAKVAAISVSEAVKVITVSINTGLVETAQRATDVLVA